MGGAIRIWGNTDSSEVEDFTIGGFSKIESVFTLWIRSNTRLSEIDGFGNLHTVSRVLDISRNNELRSLGTLSNLVTVEETGIIAYNDNLNCSVEVTKNPPMFFASHNNNVDCPSSGTEKVCDVFSLIDAEDTQTDMDKFRDCTIITTNLSIREPNSADLSYLQNLKVITRALFITSTADDGQLTSLNGLNGLQYIYGSLSIYNTNIPDLTGLDSLTTVGGNLLSMGTHSLRGLESLQTVGHSLFLKHGLPSLEGLNPQLSVGNDKVISDNVDFDCSIYFGDDAPAFFPLTVSEGNKVNCPVG